MPLLHILILALVQGITEFLPISSSGHLILTHAALNEGTDIWAQDLMLDVAVHVGTLFSVLLYFRSDMCKMLCGLKDALTGNQTSEGARLAGFVILSSLPVILAGFVLNEFQPYWLRAIEIVAWTTLLFGILLWWVDAKKPATREQNTMTWKDAVFIGLAQALALIPGTSRSGITMTASRYLGYTRTDAARYSLLLAVIAISGAGTLGGLDLIEAGSLSLTLDALLAAGLAFVSGWVAIALMMNWLKKASFKVFAVYRIALGLVLLAGIYGLVP